MHAVLVVLRGLLGAIQVRALSVMELLAAVMLSGGEKGAVKRQLTEDDGEAVLEAAELLELLVKLGLAVAETAPERDPREVVRGLLERRHWLELPSGDGDDPGPVGARQLAWGRLVAVARGLNDEQLAQSLQAFTDLAQPNRDPGQWTPTEDFLEALRIEARRRGHGPSEKGDILQRGFCYPISASLPADAPGQRAQGGRVTAPLPCPLPGDPEWRKLGHCSRHLSKDALMETALVLQDEVCDDPDTKRRRDPPLPHDDPRYRELWLYEEELQRRGCFEPGEAQPPERLWPMQTHQPFRDAPHPQSFAAQRHVFGGRMQVQDVRVPSLIDPDRYARAMYEADMRRALRDDPGPEKWDSGHIMRLWEALFHDQREHYRERAAAVLEVQRGERPGQAPPPGQHGIECPACQRISPLKLLTEGPDMRMQRCKWCGRDIANVTLEGSPGWEERAGLNRPPAPVPPDAEGAAGGPVASWTEAPAGLAALLHGPPRQTTIGADGRVLALCDPARLAALERVAEAARGVARWWKGRPVVAGGGWDEELGRLTLTLAVFDAGEAKATAPGGDA